MVFKRHRLTIAPAGTRAVARRRLLLRSLLALVATLTFMAAQGGLGRAMPAAASTGNCANNSTCRWTEMNNGNWPNGSSDPYCNPCVSWPPDPNGGGIQNIPYWNGWAGQGSIFDNEVNWAANTWGSLQYYSPSVYECSCSGTPINYEAGNEGNLCGNTTITYTSSQGNQGNITNATVYLNSQVTYSDGPSNGQAGVCDLRWTLLHETGHVFGEGHSSVNSDVMYPSDNAVEAIDQDANDMMAEVYGTYEAGCDSNYCGGHADVNLPVVVHPLTAAQLQAAEQAKAQDVQNAAAAVTADSRNIALSAKQQVFGLLVTPPVTPPPVPAPAGSSSISEP